MTIAEAEKVYKKNDCSLFVMAREDFDSYSPYQKLKIEKTLEEKWKTEVIEELVNVLKETGDWRSFNRLYDLAAGFRDKERLELMIKAIGYINIQDEETSLCIAETIMGRKVLSVRSGMIFWACDIGLRVEAVSLIRKVNSLLCIQTDDAEMQMRIDRDTRKIKEIKDMIGEK